MTDARQRRRADIRDALDPIATDTPSTSSSSGAHFQAVSRAILAPFRKRGDSTKLLSDRMYLRIFSVVIIVLHL